MEDSPQGREQTQSFGEPPTPGSTTVFIENADKDSNKTTPANRFDEVDRSNEAQWASDTNEADDNGDAGVGRPPPHSSSADMIGPASPASPTPASPLTVRSIPLTITAFSISLSLHAAIKLALYPSTLANVSTDLGLNNTLGALLSGFFDSSQVLSSILLPTIVARTGNRPLLVSAYGALMIGMGSLLYAAAPFYFLLLAAEISMGLGSACSIVLSPAVYTSLYPSEKSKASLGMSITFGFAPVACFLAFAALGVVSGDSWRLLFAMAGLSLLIPFCAYVWAEGKGFGSLLICGRSVVPTQGPDLTGMRRNDTAASPGVPTPVSATFSSTRPCGSAMKHALRTVIVPYFAMIRGGGYVMWTMWGQTSCTVGVAAVMALAFKYAGERFPADATDRAIAIQGMASVAAISVSTLGSGLIVTKFKLQARQVQWLCLGCFTGFLASSIWFCLCTSFQQFAAALTAILFFYAATFVPSTMAFSLTLHEDRSVQLANALNNILIKLLGGVPGPMILGVLLDIGVSGPVAFSLVLCGGAVMAIFCTVMALRRYTRTPVPHSQGGASDSPPPRSISTAEQQSTELN
jgi:MFS family permease